MTDTPIYGFGLVSENDTEAAKTDTHNQNMLLIEAILKRQIISRVYTVPPAASNGQLYLVPDASGSPSPSGAWAGYENYLMLYYGGWIPIPPTDGPSWYVMDEGVFVRYGTSGSPSAWSTVASGDQNFTMVIAASDETTALTAGVDKATFRIPAAVTLTAVRASLSVANPSSGSPTSGPITIDINKNGATILSTKLTIDNDELTSTTAATAAVISSASLADDDEISIDIDEAGDGVTPTGLKVVLIGTYA